MSVEIVDPRDRGAVLKFIDGMERDSELERLVLRLDHDISLGELVRAIAAAGLVISTPRHEAPLIHRKPIIEEAA